VDSTNNYAMGLVHAGMARHGTVVFTHEQTKGRGQRQKAWVSAAGLNIALSVVLEPDGFATSQMFLISQMMATAVANFMESYAKDDVKIKWPNDIYWCDRKAGGILIENVLHGSEWKFSIAGIGLNINQTDFGELHAKAVSLKQITGKNFDPLLLAKELCDELEKQWKKMHVAPNKIVQEYKSKLYKKNEAVKLKKQNRVFEAIIKDVTTNGRLVVHHSMEETFDVGEVEWII